MKSSKQSNSEIISVGSDEGERRSTQWEFCSSTDDSRCSSLSF